MLAVKGVNPAVFTGLPEPSSRAEGQNAGRRGMKSRSGKARRVVKEKEKGYGI